MGNKENTLGRAKKPWILYVMIAAIVVVGAVVALTVILPSQNNEKLEIVRSESQDALEELISSIARDTSLTTEQKDMLLSVFSSLTADPIETTDDAVLVMERLIGSRLLVGSEKSDLSSLKDRVIDKKVEDLVYIKAVISNVLDCIRSRISNEITDLTVIGKSLKTFISEVESDSALSADQKDLFTGLLKDLGRGVSGYDVNKFSNIEDIHVFLSKIVKAKMIEDEDINDLTKRLVSSMDEGATYELSDLKHITGRILYLLYNSQYLSSSSLETLRTLLSDAGIRTTDVDDIKTVEDARVIIEKLINSGLITDKTILSELNNMLSLIDKGGAVTVEQLRQVIKKALNYIDETIINEKNEYVNAQSEAGLVTYEYLTEIMNDYSGAISHLQDLSGQNAEDIDVLRQILKDKEGENKDLEERLANVEDSSDKNFESLIEEVNDKNKDLAEDINKNKKITEDQINTSNSAMAKSTNGVISGLVESLNSRNNALVNSINNGQVNLIAGINKEETRFADSVTSMLDDVVGSSNKRHSSLVKAINNSKSELVSSINNKNSDLLSSINTENNRFASAINTQNKSLVDAMNSGNDQIINTLNDQTSALADSVNTQNKALVDSVNSNNEKFASDINKAMKDMADSVNNKISGADSGFSAVAGDISKAADKESVQNAIDALSGGQSVNFSLEGTTLNITTSTAGDGLEIAGVSPSESYSTAEGDITAPTVEYGSVTGGTASAGTADTISHYTGSEVTSNNISGGENVSAGDDISSSKIDSDKVEAKSLSASPITTSDVKADEITTKEVKVSDVKLAEIRISKIAPKLIKLTQQN